MTNRLVAYFSASGVTEKVAKELASAASADLYEIRPAVPYTQEDLNWNNKKSRSSVEMSHPSSRPEIAGKMEEMDLYQVIFLGFPIWWYVAPTIINTFLEEYDFSGKTIILFATSGGSRFGKTLENLKRSVSDAAVIKEGRLLNGEVQRKELELWIDSLGLEK